MINYRFQDHKARRRRQGRMLAKMTALLSLLLVVGGVMFWAGDGAAAATGGVMMTAAIPFLTAAIPVREEFDETPRGSGHGDGGSGDEFEGKVLGLMEKQEQSMGATRKAIDEMTTKFDNLDQKTKDEFEKLRKIREDWKGLDSDVQSAVRQIKQVRAQLALEARIAYGDPMQRILSSEEKKTKLFANIATAVKMPIPENIQKALGEDSSPGSTLIDDELSTEIYDVLSRYGAWSSLGVRRMGTKTSKYPISTARPTANFILTEGGAIADDTNKAGTTVSLEAELIAVLLLVSEQLIQDGEVDVVADVLDDFVQSINERLDYAAFRGDGTADGTNGGVTGLFEFGTGVTAAATRSTVAATKHDDWIKCLTGVAEVVLGRAARWWEHPTITAASLGVVDSNGRPIFLTAQEAPTLGALGSRYGYPITPVAAAPSTDAASQKISAFGDPEAFVVGIRRDMQLDESSDYKFNTFQRAFRGVIRGDAIGRRATGITVLSTAA